VSLSRPGTSSVAPSAGVQEPQYHTIANPSVVSRPPLSRYQRPRTAQVTSPKSLSRRQSLSKQGEQPAFATISETPRASISSNGSWIKRLSLRPLSQHGSERSSIGPDSSIAAFSHASGVPILPQSRSFNTPPTPNKLVKRTTSTVDDPFAVSRRRANSNLLTLRRPATSHQRSATLHNLDRDLPYISSTPSIEAGPEWHQALLPSALPGDFTNKPRGAWASFFHSQTTAAGRALDRIKDITPQARGASNGPKRILPKRFRYQPRAHLVKPAMVSPASAPPGVEDTPASQAEPGPSSQSPQYASPTAADNTPSRKARRSISMTFSSAGELVSRASGSIRRPKRGSTPKKESYRHVSDPVFGSPSVVSRRANANPEKDYAPNPYLYSAKQGATSATKPDSPLSSRTRNFSSPASPPALPLMSFQAESPQLGSAGGASSQHPLEENQPSSSRANSTSVSQSKQLRQQQNERWYTMEGSDGDQRDFISGDEDDTDFKSDTMFDSFRTAASGRVRSVETPLDSLYDGSPPSTTSNGKSKRLSIQEILSREWNPANRIMEEDEASKTPVPSAQHLDLPPSSRDIPTEPRFSTDSMGKDLGRFSIDDDFDEDWTRDDEFPHHALSPPSKGSSLNARGINPNVRLALANISGNGVADTNLSDSRNERPLSNLFDWSEPSVQERTEASKPGLRPKTAYNNQEVDARSGRSSVRKGPTPTHVRSQSVPVVHEGPDETKSGGSKFGTWGTGTKPISEDWDDDFEFGGGNGTDNSEDDMFAVPERIQATQPSVKAHSGQIRELSLLVNDLQRLCRHAREMDLLEGKHRSLWKEAEGIIALASPDDDELEGDHDCSSSVDMDAFEAHDRSFEEPADLASLEKLDAALDGHEPVMSKTAVIRDRPSPRRRSVFSPDDDIFGVSWSLPEDQALPNRHNRPKTPEPRLHKPNDVNGVVRTVVEAMQQSSIQESLAENLNASKRMHFDTNSLKVLVKRASDLRDVLSDAVRRADQIANTPAGTPRRERQLDSSPAFTKVFDDPASSPPRRITKSRGNTLADETSPQNSPSSAMARRIRLMAVQ
jgi:hypothetical protein